MPDFSYPQDVFLYVYDLSRGLAREFSRALMGIHVEAIWHTSVVVFGSEIYFGQGIYQSLPGKTIMGEPLKKLPMGQTSLKLVDFKAYLAKLSAGPFNNTSYHLLDKNCNHFSAEVVKFLTGNSIPSYIVSMPENLISTPLGQMIRPHIEKMYGPSSILSPSQIALTKIEIVDPYCSPLIPFINEILSIPRLASDKLESYWQSTVPITTFPRLYSLLEINTESMDNIPLGESIFEEEIYPNRENPVIVDVLAAFLSLFPGCSNSQIYNLISSQLDSYIASSSDTKILPSKNSLSFDRIIFILLQYLVNSHKKKRHDADEILISMQSLGNRIVELMLIFMDFENQERSHFGYLLRRIVNKKLKDMSAQVVVLDAKAKGICEELGLLLFSHLMIKMEKELDDVTSLHVLHTFIMLLRIINDTNESLSTYLIENSIDLELFKKHASSLPTFLKKELDAL